MNKWHKGGDLKDLPQDDQNVIYVYNGREIEGSFFEDTFYCSNGFANYQIVTRWKAREAKK